MAIVLTVLIVAVAALAWCVFRLAESARSAADALAGILDAFRGLSDALADGSGAVRELAGVVVCGTEAAQNVANALAVGGALPKPTGAAVEAATERPQATAHQPLDAQAAVYDQHGHYRFSRPAGHPDLVDWRLKRAGWTVRQ